MLQRLRQWFSFDPASYEAPSGIPSPDEERHLTLYKYDTCPFCMRVRRVLDATGVEVEFADIRTDPEALRRLQEVTGRRTVPCLFIDDVPMFESRDISRWLMAYAERWA
jgi:glutaredoxin